MTSSDHDGGTVSVGGRAGRNNRLIGVGGVVSAVAMIGLTYAAAPFYSAFCRATGYEGTPQQVKANTDAEGRRILRVGFDANIAPGLQWRLEPEVEFDPGPHGQNRYSLFPGAQSQRQSDRRSRYIQRDARSFRGIFQQDLMLLLHDPTSRPT